MYSYARKELTLKQFAKPYDVKLNLKVTTTKLSFNDIMLIIISHRQGVNAIGSRKLFLKKLHQL